jgi:Xaa-Pro aminopeptidase
VRKVEDQAKDMEFDIPYRDLGFYGVPPHNKSTCFIMPSVNALVELTEPPWFVATLNDIEVAHFERVVYGLKNFDLVLVLKDFNQKPVHVNSINVEHLDPLKTWLDSCNIKFYEGTTNLNWVQIMKHINGIIAEGGPEAFYDDGGWKFLCMYDSEDEEDEDPDDLESDFAPSGSGSEEGSEDSDDSDFDDEVDSEDDSEGSGEESLDSDESEGKDWDELDAQAKRADKEKGRFDEDERPKSKRSRDYSASESDSEDDRKKKKKSSAPPTKSGSSKSSKPSSSSSKPSKPSGSSFKSSSKPSSSSGKSFKR